MVSKKSLDNVLSRSVDILKADAAGMAALHCPTN
jgi:hypothetical protein